MFAFTSVGARATRMVGEALGSVARPGDVIVLAGDLGAGKTVLAKGVAAGLGVAVDVTSPTFNILLEYEGRARLAHFDLFRIEAEAYLEDVDFWGVLESGAVCLVEWGDRFPGALPQDVVTARIRVVAEDVRRIEISAGGARSERLAQSWADACVQIDQVPVQRIGA